MFLRAASAILAAALLVGGAHAAPPWPDLLAKVGLTPDTAQVDRGKWTGGGAYRLSGFQRLWDDWRLLDDETITTGREVLLGAGDLGGLILAAAPKIDVAVEPPKALPPPQPPTQEALLRSLRHLCGLGGKPLDGSALAALKASAAKVPAPVAIAAALILDTVPDAVAARNKAFARFGPPASLAAPASKLPDLAVAGGIDDELLRLMDTVDQATLVKGCLNLALATDVAAHLLSAVPRARFSFTADTPFGKVVLNGAAADDYPAADYLLIIDTGGNDRYHGGAGTATPSLPVSVCIDVAGNDTYESAAPAFGLGLFGYGFLLDLGGNDTYRAPTASLGCGLTGVGLLIDGAGNDTYDVHHLGEGAAFFGLGILSDLSGDDRYKCYMCAQGYGAPRGCGVLVDGSGDDSYEANDTDIVNPSPQTAQHNVSLAQGAGFGRRAHPGDGHSLAGGFGILADGAGNDHYKCGVFGQGVAYWYSVGMLYDAAGDDAYDGVWYVQGTAAHYAVGSLCDLGGSDHYVASMAQSQGQGHDFSLGWLHDDDAPADRDIFEGPGSSLGLGLWNGLGFFWHHGGKPDYPSPGATFGGTGDSRPETLCLGLFADEAGEPKFPAGSKAVPHTTWVQPPVKDHPLARGVGYSQGPAQP
jgi:hypothetical protein